MPVKVKYGFKAQVYLNGAAYGSPTWTALGNISDCALGADFDSAEANLKGLNGIKAQEPTLLGLGITGKIRSDDGDTTGYVALETATLTRAALDVLVLDGDIATAGSRGFRFDVKNFKWGEDQGPGNVLFREFDLRPCIPINGSPQKAVVSSGESPAPVFTAL